MSWGINLNPEGTDPDIEAIAKRNLRASQWATEELSTPALKSRLTEMTKEARRQHLYNNAGYMGVAGALIKLVTTMKDPKNLSGLTPDEAEAVTLVVVGDFLKRMVVDKDKIEEF